MFNIPLAIRIVVIAGSLLVGYWQGYSHVQSKWNLQKMHDAQALVEAQSKIRDLEHQHVQAVQQVSESYQKEISNGKTKLDDALNRLHDAQRLRNANAASSTEGKTTTSTGGYSNETGTDFLTAHGSDALRLASEADEVVNQLYACQRILETERSGN